LDGVRLVLQLRALPATHRIFYRAISLLALIIRSFSVFDLVDAGIFEIVARN